MPRLSVEDPEADASVPTVAPGDSSAGSVRIRPADLDIDAEFIVAAVRTHLNPAADHARFNWLYRRNPDGEARAWIAEDGNTGVPVGLAAAFPRQIYLRGRPTLGWILGDF